MNIIILIISAFILDLIIGDPRWFPNPVKFIGKMIIDFENPLRRMIKNQYMAGVIFLILIISIISGITWLCIYLVAQINQYLEYILATIILYTVLSIKDLKDQTFEVFNALKKNDLKLARKKLSIIVGRDTHKLNKKEIIRATVETIAESTVDGIIAPLFYAVCGGPILAMIYKSINTLDSMVGYKNKRYKEFGWVSAKLDDIMNFIPARISAIIIPIASWIYGKKSIKSFYTILRDGRNHPSPNSGIPEAGFAGALGVQLGGNSYYKGILLKKPLIGEKKVDLKLNHIKSSIALSYITSLVMVIALFFIWFQLKQENL